MKRVLALLRSFDQKHWMTAAAIVALGTAIWMPDIVTTRHVFTYVVTFDITQSTNVPDVTLNGVPMSRLALARTAAHDALQRMPCGSRIGWSVFTGNRSLLLLSPIEVCAHYDVLQSSLDGIDGRMRWANASRIANGGLYSAVRQAERLGQGTAVVFITDGQEAPPRLAGDTSVLDVKRGAVNGWLIGMGGERPAPIPKSGADGRQSGYWRASDVVQTSAMPGAPIDPDSHEELSELREAYLKALANEIGFNYSRLSTPAALEAALLDPRMARPEPVATDMRWCPALVALVLLAWCFLPGLDWRRLVSDRLARESKATAPGGFWSLRAHKPHPVSDEQWVTTLVEERHRG
ncbi:putative MxaL-like protein [Paraburkholderia ribeironis]|uniref:Putative MxaL-like protein n=1 Tax=Paraburkholderia ribeironis TaxID=1247936 RepID=A0A1N7S8X4_9BURK|nr:VWA domain-containing protein [Paraburkholderia ribeironis]SIT43773.1 putative MxaL-like protein [Paraburkholderia ribeironis]